MTATGRLVLALNLLLCGAGLAYVIVGHSRVLGADSGPADNLSKTSPVAVAAPFGRKALDRDITRTIRTKIANDAKLSAYAHNVKVFTLAGKVTLLGPVRSLGEKKNIEAKAQSVVGPQNVSGKLDIIN